MNRMSFLSFADRIAQRWSAGGMLVVALALSAPAQAGFDGGNDTTGGECPPECMCIGLDCPEVAADCSACDDVDGSGVEAECPDDERDLHEVPGDGSTTVHIVRGPEALSCEIYDDNLCALGYFYMLAACAGDAPVPKPIGDVRDAAEFGKWLEDTLDTIGTRGPKVRTLDDLGSVPGLGPLVEGLKCASCVALADEWAAESCPDVLGVAPWRSQTSEVCVEAALGGSYMVWLDATVIQLMQCQVY
jgi:hypothetical protein